MTTLISIKVSKCKCEKQDSYCLTQGSLSRVYGLLITRVSLKINGGMWLIVYDQQSIHSALICFS